MKKRLTALLQYFVKNTRGANPWEDADDEWVDQYLSQHPEFFDNTSIFTELEEVEKKYNVTLVIYPDYVYWTVDDLGNTGRELYGANYDRLSSIRLAIDIMNDDALRAEYMDKIVLG